MAKRNQVTERDFGWKRINAEIGKAKGAGVKVGVLADSEPHEDGEDMIDIALTNEFGDPSRRIPARPFVRGAFDQHVRYLQQTKSRLWDQILAGRMDTNRALGLLGETHQSQVQSYMTALDTPPNAPRTIAQKGSSNPLIDSGRLRLSIRWERD
jgi:hypothetical protein